MMMNPDGTPYSAETIAEWMRERFEDQTFPQLSDLLGSDWGMNFAPSLDPETYRRNAYAMAARLYDDYGGWLQA